MPVEPNKPLKAATSCSRSIRRPTRRRSNDRSAAQVRRTAARADDSTATERPGRAFDVEQRQAEVDKLKGQLEGAKWNLEQTVVRAPADGYVTNLGLMQGARVRRSSPVMAFIDTSETVVGVEIRRSIPATSSPAAGGRSHVQVFPGQVYTGKVEAVLQATSPGRPASGLAVTPRQVTAAPFVVRVKLDDPSSAASLPVPAMRRSTPTHQAEPHHPQGDPAADRDRELRQPVLNHRSQ